VQALLVWFLVAPVPAAADESPVELHYYSAAGFLRLEPGELWFLDAVQALLAWFLDAIHFQDDSPAALRYSPGGSHRDSVKQALLALPPHYFRENHSQKPPV
jgi:hypothetical protein